jgi:hypothetical protein
MFLLLLRINSDYLPKQHKPVGLCNGSVVCFVDVSDIYFNPMYRKVKLERLEAKQKYCHDFMK